MIDDPAATLPAALPKRVQVCSYKHIQSLAGVIHTVWNSDDLMFMCTEEFVLATFLS